MCAVVGEEEGVVVARGVLAGLPLPAPPGIVRGLNAVEGTAGPAAVNATSCRSSSWKCRVASSSARSRRTSSVARISECSSWVAGAPVVVVGVVARGKPGEGATLGGLPLPLPGVLLLLLLPAAHGEGPFALAPSLGAVFLSEGGGVGAWL